MKPLFQKQLALSGFNACILPTPEGYIGLTRVCKQHEQRGVYPEATNECVLFHLDHDFNTISQNTLTDATGRQTYQGWTRGIEDARLLTPSSFVAVTCDTNPRWKPEVSHISFTNNNTISNITPLYLNGTQNEPQKNWLFIRKHTDTLHDYLYSSFPFRVVRVNTESGEATHLQTLAASHPQLQPPPISHNGAITQLPDGCHLLTVRIKHNYDYHYSLWILLSSELQPTAISKPFRFFHAPQYCLPDGTFAPGSYEMCMSLHVEDTNTLVACVSENDAASYVQKYNLQELLANMV